jgi:hypothetical protein
MDYEWDVIISKNTRHIHNPQFLIHHFLRHFQFQKLTRKTFFIYY